MLLTNNTDRATEPSYGREGQSLAGSRIFEDEAYDTTWRED
jgi:hypothetical protein